MIHHDEHFPGNNPMSLHDDYSYTSRCVMCGKPIYKATAYYQYWRLIEIVIQEQP